MKAVKSRKVAVLCQGFVWLLMFAPQTWFSLHAQKLYEAALYSIALVASVFLTAMFLRDEGREKAGKAVGQEKHQGETST